MMEKASARDEDDDDDEAMAILSKLLYVSTHQKTQRLTLRLLRQDQSS